MLSKFIQETQPTVTLVIVLLLLLIYISELLRHQAKALIMTVECMLEDASPAKVGGIAVCVYNGHG